ncbi:transcriptional regulator (plasmid) [Rhodococcus oxybenzonivorans]|uniref:Transcriptional regulator n=1 Tax=Rhodococcus oxybenzonivorans TaxID=1990687 RepID=A0A2S2C732_9NOCA|nr:transcriptional regulator [Rhodococcus oxybenzonivorans]AWK76701.1 transcriptional regulator [Rhodococcus oxybenzonivorans]
MNAGRIPQSRAGAGIEAFVVDAFAQLDIEARPPITVSGSNADLVVDPDGVAVPIHLEFRTLITVDVAERLLTDIAPSIAAAAPTPLLVVADRVTEDARTVLIRHHGGYLDLRGRLALRTDRLVIDAEVQPVKERTARSEALGGKAGLEVATAMLLHPERAGTVRGLARELGRSPSTVSEILAALRRDDLLDANNILVGTDLFWQVAGRWTSPRVHLAQPPTPGDTSLQRTLRLGLDALDGPGWALTDSAAAAAYGAPLAFRAGHTLDFFVPDPSILRRASTLLGTAESARHAHATVRVAPVPAVVQSRIELDTNPLEWPLAHPVFVALDLAQDLGRGREILDAWTPGERWTRVW